MSTRSPSQQDAQLESYRKLVVTTLSTDFRKATRIVTVKFIPDDLPPLHLFVRITTVGINASEINFTSGKYTPGVEPPFDAGLEAIGT